MTGYFAPVRYFTGTLEITKEDIMAAHSMRVLSRVMSRNKP